MDDSSIEAQEIYCPECGDDYTLAWSTERETMFVVCGCGEAEPVDEFHDRLVDEYIDDDDYIKGYQ